MVWLLVYMVWQCGGIANVGGRQTRADDHSADKIEAKIGTRTASVPIALVVDSTGLRVHGGREWKREKHGLPKARKNWRISASIRRAASLWRPN